MTFTEPTDEQYRDAGRAVAAYLGANRKWNWEDATDLAETIADIIVKHIPSPAVNKDTNQGEVEFWQTVATALDIPYEN